jgi:hypothetical protein
MRSRAQQSLTAAWLLGGILVALLIVEAGLSLAGSTPAVTLDGGLRAAVRLWLAIGAGGTVLGTFGLGATGRPRYVAVGVLATPVALVYSYTSLVLPWTQLSFWVGQVTVETLLTVPGAGPRLAQGLVGGFTLSQTTLERAHTLHRAVVWLTVLALAGWGGRAAWTHRNRSTLGES